MKTPVTFQPDLIVEATAVCDRQCAGCYAPNLISRESPTEMLARRPDLFLRTENLRDSLRNHRQAAIDPIRVVGVRGGEPTRHPYLADLLSVLRDQTGATIYLETHGRWLLNDQPNTELFQRLAATRTVVKLSFDQMHGLSTEALRVLTSRLDQEGISWCVAITEPDEAAFSSSRTACAWVPESQVFYQPKADSSDDLLRAGCSVIAVNGILSTALSVRPSFLSAGVVA